MKKKLSILTTAVLALSLSASAQALTTGDIAFTSFNADEDGWSLVTFVDIAANSTIFFTDNEWSGTVFNSGEGQHTWNTGASLLSAGSVVRFLAVDKDSRSASIGTLTSIGDTGLNATNETIYAFIGTDANTPLTFLAGISSEGSTNLTPAGLENGVSAVVVTNSTDYAEYTGPRSDETTFAAYTPKVNNVANWNILVGGSQADKVPDTTAFTVTAVPEPESYALLLAGLGLVGFMARRRKI